jgi:hypothetical protein
LPPKSSWWKRRRSDTTTNQSQWEPPTHPAGSAPAPLQGQPPATSSPPPAQPGTTHKRRHYPTAQLAAQTYSGPSFDAAPVQPSYPGPTDQMGPAAPGMQAPQLFTPGVALGGPMGSPAPGVMGPTAPGQQPVGGPGYFGPGGGPGQPMYPQQGQQDAKFGYDGVAGMTQQFGQMDVRVSSKEGAFDAIPIPSSCFRRLPHIRLTHCNPST